MELSDKWLDAATDIGAQLCRDALWSRGHCNWIGPTVDVSNGSATVYRALGPELYEGTSGIGLFLAQLHRLRPDPMFAEAAIGALAHAAAQRERIVASGRVGLFSGWYGIAFALALASHAVDAPWFELEAKRILAEAETLTLDAATLDIIAGSAGAIAALLALVPVLSIPGLRSDAARLGDHLLKHAARRSDGLSWDMLPGFTQQHPTGFAHGAAGGAWALSELYSHVRDDRYRSAAIDAFRYESSVFDHSQQNWPDFRVLGHGRVPCALAWCHGAPGIALSRARASDTLGDGPWRADARVAVDTTFRGTQHSISQGLFRDCSLCHGLFGNLEILLLATDAPRRSEILSFAEDAATRALRNREQLGYWPCGIPNAPETPGLMLGLAGIGYFFLRLAAPDAVSTVLAPYAHACSSGHDSGR
jgi:type 2 lantibiotic biosynthesis protein LanM